MNITTTNPPAAENLGSIVRTEDIDEKEVTEILKQSRKKKSPFRIWTQQNNDKEAQKIRYWLMKKSTTAYCIMDFLASKMDHYNAVICSYKVLQEVFGYSRVTISEAIKLLKKYKYIDTKKSGTSNIYMVNKYLYWNSWGTNFAYAEFDAKVIISTSEQDEDTTSEVNSSLKKRQTISLEENNS